MKKAGRQNSMLPFVMVNMAMTADGKIATANRKVSSFGSRRDQENLYELRATADAVIAGAGTVGHTKVNLGPGEVKYLRLRLNRRLREYNLRVVVSGSGALNPHAEIFKKRFSPVIVLTTARASKTRLRQLQAVADEVKVCGRREVDFRAALQWLHSKWGVKRLLCEGGGELNDALFRAGLVNELHLTICPRIFGGKTAPTIAEGVDFSRLANALKLKIKSFKPVGIEVFAVFRPVH
jgi:2,5-diamino-6-(ribosylamino)-4(3H)-pyrimidinone 5'-phosphate reductase